ncbi:MAG: hypothetical protein EAZ89_02640 [Bacteroidetes bacterium]|nr:MAG: hypothetical protein EAZ89_02640 [Bacteroidota bacterium]
MKTHKSTFFFDFAFLTFCGIFPISCADQNPCPNSEKLTFSETAPAAERRYIAHTIKVSCDDRLLIEYELRDHIGYGYTCDSVLVKARKNIHSQCEWDKLLRERLTLLDTARFATDLYNINQLLNLLKIKDIHHQRDSSLFKKVITNGLYHGVDYKRYHYFSQDPAEWQRFLQFYAALYTQWDSISDVDKVALSGHYENYCMIKEQVEALAIVKAQHSQPNTFFLGIMNSPGGLVQYNLIFRYEYKTTSTGIQLTKRELLTPGAYNFLRTYEF